MRNIHFFYRRMYTPISETNRSLARLSLLSMWKFKNAMSFLLFTRITTKMTIPSFKLLRNTPSVTIFKGTCTDNLTFFWNLKDMVQQNNVFLWTQTEKTAETSKALWFEGIEFHSPRAVKIINSLAPTLLFLTISKSSCNVRGLMRAERIQSRLKWLSVLPHRYYMIEALQINSMLTEKYLMVF